MAAASAIPVHGEQQQQQQRGLDSRHSDHRNRIEQNESSRGRVKTWLDCGAAATAAEVGYCEGVAVAVAVAECQTTPVPNRSVRIPVAHPEA